MSQSQSAFHTNRSSVLTQSQNDRMQNKTKHNYGIGDGCPGYSEGTISSNG